MKNKPVAWRSKSPDGYWSLYGSPVEGAEPLYTGFKQLTDEEMNQAIEYATMQGYGSSYLEGLSDGLEMANAILRKAQEK